LAADEVFDDGWEHPFERVIANKAIAGRISNFIPGTPQLRFL
jgi:hypothetical protein